MFEEIVELLKSEGVSFTMHSHPMLRTVADMDAFLPFPLENMLKTVAFRVKGGSLVLAANRGQERIDYRKVAAAFGVNRRALRSLSPDAVSAELSFPIGGVCPITLRDDVEVVIDEAVWTMESVYCGSGKPTATLEIGAADLVRLSRARVLSISRID
jgi:Cys-tRNA(Pro)/Cys-tRNA(Cys) deacylase